LEKHTVYIFRAKMILLRRPRMTGGYFVQTVSMGWINTEIDEISNNLSAKTEAQ
jgi:hypothetical protein